MTPRQRVKSSELYETVVQIVRASGTLARSIGAPLVLGDQIVGAIVDLKVDGGDD